MMYVISLEKLTDFRLNLWSHEVLGVVSSEGLVPRVLFDLTLVHFPQFADSVDLDTISSYLTYAFLHREDNSYFKYVVEANSEFSGSFYVELVPNLE